MISIRITKTRGLSLNRGRLPSLSLAVRPVCQVSEADVDSNFILADGRYLKLADGRIFAVKEIQ